MLEWTKEMHIRRWLWRALYSGMWRRLVRYKVKDISEETTGLIFRAEKLAKQETFGKQENHLPTEVQSSETSMNYRTTLRHILENTYFDISPALRREAVFPSSGSRSKPNQQEILSSSRNAREILPACTAPHPRRQIFFREFRSSFAVRFHTRTQ
jgi:hypothetical protein